MADAKREMLTSLINDLQKEPICNTSARIVNPQLLTAIMLATSAHDGQKRKVTGEPYILHPLRVMRLAGDATDWQHIEVLVAAVLHDIVEDTVVTSIDVRYLFGHTVSSIVAELTDDLSVPQSKRKQQQVEYAALKSREAAVVKLADAIDNVGDIKRNGAPKHWSAARTRGYLLLQLSKWNAFYKGASQFKSVWRRYIECLAMQLHDLIKSMDTDGTIFETFNDKAALETALNTFYAAVDAPKPTSASATP